MTTESGDTGSMLARQAILARRLNLLLDAAMAERGSAITFREVQKKLADRGIGMSRARWFYMKDGTGRLVSDERVLAGICDIFDVDPSYLLGGESEELPDSIQARLEFVKSLRAARVKAFAARTLADVSPETLRAINEYLNRDIAAHGEDATAVVPSDTESARPEGP